MIITIGLGMVVLIVCVVKRKSKATAVIFAFAFAITFASVSNSIAETATVNEVAADFAFDFSYMFNDIEAFTTLDISMLNMSSMYSMKSIFSYMTNLTNIKLPTVEITDDFDLSELFDQDTSLVTVDISPIIFDEYSCPILENMFRSNKNLVTIYANSTVNYYDNNGCVWVENGYLGDSDYVRDFTIFGGDTKLVGGNGSAYATDRPKGNYPNAGSDYDDSNYYEPANEAPCFRINKVNNRTGFLTLKP